MEIKSEFININDRCIHVRVYNPQCKKTVVCWHGLARNSFDFEIIAMELGKTNRVICPDTIGRGLSQWAQNPKVEYTYPNYIAIAIGICNYFDIEKMNWIGTSMGGLIGIVLSSNFYKETISRLIINDIGPTVPPDALKRIIEYTSGKQPMFDTFIEYQDYLKQLYGIWGERTDKQWNKMTETSLRRTSTGQFTVHFDPRIIETPDTTSTDTTSTDKTSTDKTPPDKTVSDEALPEITLWEPFNMIECPILLLHGLNSDVLTLDIVEQMKLSQLKMKVVSFQNCGHAPGLHTQDQIDPILKFLADE